MHWVPVGVVEAAIGDPCEVLWQNCLTMTSREIAELTCKRHPDVRRDIRNMLEALKRDVSSFAHTYKDSAGRDQEEYRLDRELTLILV
jgi:phage regulator Rha-like protein